MDLSHFRLFYLPLLIGYSIAVAVMAGTLVVLRRIRGYQRIYELSPESHQRKTKTVSMGGIGIVLGIVVLIAIAGLWKDPKVAFCMAVLVAFSIVGGIDDVMSMVRGKNLGLTARVKFALQMVLAGLFVAIFHHWVHPLAVWELGLYGIMFAGVSNATNLTDGLDGLLGGLAMISLVGFGAVFATQGQYQMMVVTWAAMAAVAGFLVFNLNPAKIFMGDTGSLALGAFFVSLAMVAGNPWMLLLLGGVYLVETLSVMVQVASFKLAGKRVFKMAPLHHHFELSGYSERQVVGLFWAAGFILLGVFVWGWM